MINSNGGSIDKLKYVLDCEKEKENTTSYIESDVDDIPEPEERIEDFSNHVKVKYSDLPNDEHEADYTMIYLLLSMLESHIKDRIPSKYWEFLMSHKLDVEIEIKKPVPEFVNANIVVVYREFLVSDNERIKLLRKSALELFIEKMDSVDFLIEQNPEMKIAINSFKEMLDEADKIENGNDYVNYTDQFIEAMHPAIKRYVLKCIVRVESVSEGLRANFL